MSKIMVNLYSIDDSIHQFSIGYIINPSLHFNKVFREQVEILKFYISLKYNGNN